MERATNPLSIEVREPQLRLVPPAANPFAGVRIDGRWFLWGSHLCLFWVAVLKYDLPRTVFQFVTAYVVAVIVELILNAWLKKYPRATARDRILSAVAEAAGLLLLVASPHPYYYAISSAIAVASKYVFVRHDGIHIFNPTNFAIVFGFAVFPNDFFAVFADEYSRNFYPIAHVLAFGTFAVIFGRAYMTTIGYFTGLLIVAALAELIAQNGFVKSLYPELGAFGMIFAFLMITDPKTTPGRGLLKFFFGLAVAITMMIFRHFEFCYPHFFALFFITTVTYALSFRFRDIYRRTDGATAQVPLAVP